jgi:hypothetical protein
MITRPLGARAKRLIRKGRQYSRCSRLAVLYLFALENPRHQTNSWNAERAYGLGAAPARWAN